MKIERTRWVILRNNPRNGRREIYCGLARNYEFKPIDNIGNTSIKTYNSKHTAVSAFQKSWSYIDFAYDVVKVTETVTDEIGGS